MRAYVLSEVRRGRSAGHSVANYAPAQQQIDYGAQGYTPSPLQEEENGEFGTKTLLRVPWGKDSSFEVPEREGSSIDLSGICIHVHCK